MTIQKHLDFATLMSYSSGALSEPLSAVVFSHTELCFKCKSELKKMDLIGSALLEDIEPADLDKRSIESIVSHQITDSNAPESEKSHVEVDLRRLVMRLLHGQSTDIDWKWLGPGMKYYKIPLSKDVQGDLRLVKFAPGIKIPEHGHNGAELTLVLKGAYRDETGRYGPGDIADLDEDIEHQPVVEDAEECICLVGAESYARFKGMFNRLLQPLFGM